MTLTQLLREHSIADVHIEEGYSIITIGNGRRFRLIPPQMTATVEEVRG